MTLPPDYCPSGSISASGCYMRALGPDFQRSVANASGSPHSSPSRLCLFLHTPSNGSSPPYGTVPLALDSSASVKSLRLRQPAEREARGYGEAPAPSKQFSSLHLGLKPSWQGRRFYYYPHFSERELRLQGSDQPGSCVSKSWPEPDLSGSQLRIGKLLTLFTPNDIDLPRKCALKPGPLLLLSAGSQEGPLGSSLN